jgi:hypothetical protein
MILADARLIGGPDLGHQPQCPGNVADRRVVAGEVERAGQRIGGLGAVAALVAFVGLLRQAPSPRSPPPPCAARRPGSWRSAGYRSCRRPAPSGTCSRWCGAGQRTPGRRRPRACHGRYWPASRGCRDDQAQDRPRRAWVSSSSLRAAKQSPTSSRDRQVVGGAQGLRVVLTELFLEAVVGFLVSGRACWNSPSARRSAASPPAVMRACGWSGQSTARCRSRTYVSRSRASAKRPWDRSTLAIWKRRCSVC